MHNYDVTFRLAGSETVVVKTTASTTPLALRAALGAAERDKLIMPASVIELIEVRPAT